MGLPNHRPARLRHAQGQIYASPPRTAGPRFPAVAAALAQVSSGAAVDLTPRWLQTIVGLNGYDLNAWEAAVVRQIGAFADPLRACSAISAEAGAAIADTVTFGVFFLGVVGDEALCARRWLPGNSAVCYRLSWGMLDEEDLEWPRSPAALNSRFIGARACQRAPS